MIATRDLIERGRAELDAEEDLGPSRPSWHLAPGPGFNCAQCAGKVDVRILPASGFEPGTVIATCRKCRATREWDLPGDYRRRPGVDRIQFVNVVPVYDFGEGEP
jgi:hypothetical protein